MRLKSGWWVWLAIPVALLAVLLMPMPASANQFLSEKKADYLGNDNTDGAGGTAGGYYSAAETPLLFDGVSVDATNLLSLTVTDPTAAREQVFDDKSGTIMVSGTDQAWATTGTLTYTAQVVTKTQADTPYAASATDVRHGVINNAGATGALHIDLPAAVAGMSVLIKVRAAFDIDIDPNGTNQIRVLTNAGGDKLSSDATEGSLIALFCDVDGEWSSTGYIGVWTDAD